MSLECNEQQFFINLNKYKLDENENICSNNSSWFSLKNSKNKKNNKLNMFKINEGDVIKIGKIIIRIRKIKFENLRKFNNKHKLNININDENNESFFSSILSDKIDELNEIGTNNNINTNINTILYQKTNIDNNSEITPKKDINKEKNTLSINKKNSNNNNKLSTFKKNNNIHINTFTNTDFPQKCCRICYLDDDTLSNPLIQPCLCSGSLKYIHLNCLKQWIGTRNYTRLENNDHCSIYLIKEIDCELCKNKLPDFIRHKNKLYKLIDFNIEFKNYISFENLTLDKQKNKFIYVINLDNKKEIKIGRGHEANILLSDISVSRVHCLLNVINKNIYLEDNNAKYGTLVLVQTQNLNIIDNIDLNLQIGRSFISCKIKEPFKLFKCCDNVHELINYNSYFKQNAKKIGMRKIMTVKTEVDEMDEKEERKEIEIKKNNNVNINNNKVNNDEPVMEIDLNVDEDENINRSNFNFNITKYTFISNDNCKNLLLNSLNLKKIEIISPLKSMVNKRKEISRNLGFMNINNSTGILPLTQRTPGKICFK